MFLLSDIPCHALKLFLGHKNISIAKHYLKKKNVALRLFEIEGRFSYGDSRKCTHLGRLGLLHYNHIWNCVTVKIDCYAQHN